MEATAVLKCTWKQTRYRSTLTHNRLTEVQNYLSLPARHLGREVKAADSKSAGLCPREFEPHRCRAFVAQLAERSAVNRQVPGSIPGEGVFYSKRSINLEVIKINMLC